MNNRVIIISYSGSIPTTSTQSNIVAAIASIVDNEEVKITCLTEEEAMAIAANACGHKQVSVANPTEGEALRHAMTYITGVYADILPSAGDYHSCERFTAIMFRDACAENPHAAKLKNAIEIVTKSPKKLLNQSHISASIVNCVKSVANLLNI